MNKNLFRGYLPYFCTGFLALKASYRTNKLLKKWNEIYGKDQNDGNQRSFQKAVIVSKAKGKALPLQYFPSGMIFFEQMPRSLREKVVVIHNNFIVGKNKKIQRFQYFGLWFTNFHKGKYSKSPKLA